LKGKGEGGRGSSGDAIHVWKIMFMKKYLTKDVEFNENFNKLRNTKNSFVNLLPLFSPFSVGVLACTVSTM
jgi:hypothetical protein